jgi:hypothetical protein
VSSEKVDLIRQMVRQAVVEALGGAAGEPVPSPPPASEPSRSPREYYSPWTGNAYEAHPSQRRLVEIGNPPAIWETAVGQPCPLENRPCDDCGKCRAFGF